MGFDRVRPHPTAMIADDTWRFREERWGLVGVVVVVDGKRGLGLGSTTVGLTVENRKKDGTGLEGSLEPQGLKEGMILEILSLKRFAIFLVCLFLFFFLVGVWKRNWRAKD